MPSLVVIFGRDRGRVFALPRGNKLVIGRSHDLPYRLNDPSVSRQHLEFIHQKHDGKCIVVDLKSRNGAMINNKHLLHSHELNDGDIVQVGYSLIVFVRVVFDANNPVTPFLDTCEKEYEPYLNRLRDHASMHTVREAGDRSTSQLSGTMQLGHIWGKKEQR